MDDYYYTGDKMTTGETVGCFAFVLVIVVICAAGVVGGLLWLCQMLGV